MAGVGIPCAAGSAVAVVKANDKVVWRDGKAGNTTPDVGGQERTASHLIFKVAPGRWRFSTGK